MICFEIHLNGDKLCRAGVGDTGVLSAIVSWVGHAPEQPNAGEPGLFLQVGGLYGEHPDGKAHAEWVDNRQLVPGDELTVRIVESDHVDDPIGVKITTAAQIAEQQRRYYERLKQQFEDHI